MEVRQWILLFVVFAVKSITKNDMIWATCPALIAGKSMLKKRRITKRSVPLLLTIREHTNMSQQRRKSLESLSVGAQNEFGFSSKG